jgi:hypothetical protein
MWIDKRYAVSEDMSHLFISVPRLVDPEKANFLFVR